MSESSSTKLGIQACTLLFISLFIRGTHHSFIITEEKSLVKNQLVAILYKLPKEYQLSFEFKPIEFLNVWGIIAHLTIGGDMTNYGDRTPSIMISPERYLVVTSAINGFVNYFKICTEINIPLNEWTSIKVSQQMIETKYIFTIEVSGQQIFTIENTDAREFDHVKVYMSDPWDTVQPGYIRNLEISNVVAEKNCSLTSLMFSTSINDEIRVRGNILTTPICLINLQNIIIFLRHEPGLSFKDITWHGLNVTSIDEEERFTMIYLKEFFAGSYFYFEARFYVAFNQIPGGKEKFSVAVDISWFEYFLQQQISKVNKQLFLSRLKSPETPVNKVIPIWKPNQQKTFFQTATYLYVCTSISKRQQSSCYQQNRNSGKIMTLPIQLLDVIGYDANTTFLYGYNYRSKIVEVDVNRKKQLVIISDVAWLQIKDSDHFLSV